MTEVSGVSGDCVAWLTGESGVSNARMEVLSLSPLRLRDTLTGSEYGPEHIIAISRFGRGAFVTYGQEGA